MLNKAFLEGYFDAYMYEILNEQQNPSNRPVTTLFLLQSLDGKISTGPTDNFDVDKDIPKLSGNPAQGLHQYYEAEQETDLWSLNSGRVMAKVGYNSKPFAKERCPVNFVIIDNNHLTDHGVSYTCSVFNHFYLVTSNKNHPAYLSNEDNLTIIEYNGKFNPKNMLEELYKYGCKELTIQTGSTLNNIFLRNHLIDKVNIVICPILVGGTNTSSLIGGSDVKKLSDIGILNLTKIKKLNNSYIEVFYDVVN